LILFNSYIESIKPNLILFNSYKESNKPNLILFKYKTKPPSDKHGGLIV
jgi:hypothetical protein